MNDRGFSWAGFPEVESRQVVERARALLVSAVSVLGALGLPVYAAWVRLAWEVLRSVEATGDRRDDGGPGPLERDALAVEVLREAWALVKGVGLEATPESLALAVEVLRTTECELAEWDREFAEEERRAEEHPDVCPGCAKCAKPERVELRGETLAVHRATCPGCPVCRERREETGEARVRRMVHLGSCAGCDECREWPEREALNARRRRR